MLTPDITKAQVAAVAQALLAVVVAFGVNITEEQSVALLGLSGIVAAVLTLADAAIRRGRAKALGGTPVIPEFDPSEAVNEAKAALHEHLERPPTEEELDTYLDTGKSPLQDVPPAGQ